MRNKVRVFRKKAGITLKELSKRAGIHYTNLSQIENFKVPLYPRWAERIGMALGVDAEKLK